MPRAKTNLPSASSYRLYLLGGFRLERDGAPHTLKRIKAQPLLAYLALFPQEHRREQVAAALWAESTDADARLSLRVTLNSLRTEISPDLVLSDRETMQLNPAFPLWTDASEFLASGRADFDDSIPNLKSKIVNYRGDLLPDHYDEWLVPVRERVRDSFLELALRLVEHYRGASDYAQAIEIAQRVLQVDRANETAHQHLIFCYAAMGDRASALKQFEECVRALREELEVEPSPETRALVQRVTQDANRVKSPAAALTNLPRPVTSFVGRETEMTELHARLQQARTNPDANRLLTLTGAGGSGKTRLAIQVARQLVEDYADGVWFIDLAPLSDASLVPQTISQALGIEQGRDETTTDTLANYLQTRSILLILDNCEHLLSACAQLSARLLSDTTNVTLLATSREALNIGGEAVWHVPTLTIPTYDLILVAASPGSFPAVRLFVERAQAAKPDFQLTESNLPVVVEICQRLDGMPLAIELAAARVKMLAPHEIAAHLDHRFDLLTGGSRAALPRQQTLRALLDWSFDLLAEDERILLRRLAVFAGGWTLDAAEQISSDTTLPKPKIVSALAGLVDKSLVLVQSSDEVTRYRFLETIREYAREKLDQAHELDTLQNRHLEFFITFAERAEPELYGRNQKGWADRLERDHDNFRMALEGAFKDDTTNAGVQLAGALGYFWHQRGYAQEGNPWLERALACANEQTAAIWRARAYSSAGTLAWFFGKIGRALEYHARALELYTSVGDEWHIAFSMTNLAVQYKLQGMRSRADELYATALALAEKIDSPFLIYQAALSMSVLRMIENNLEAAEPLIQKAFRASTTNGDPSAQALVALNLAEVQARLGQLSNARQSIGVTSDLVQIHHLVYLKSTLAVIRGYICTLFGETDAARGIYLDGLAEAKSHSDVFGMVRILEAFAVLQAQSDSWEKAVQIWGCSAEWRVRQGEHMLDVDIPGYAETVLVAKDALGAEYFAALWRQGGQLEMPSLADRLIQGEF